MKIGLAGTGRMGAAMAIRLMSCGHDCTVWNRTAEKTRALAAAGAKVAATPAELAAAAELIISILTDAAAIDAVYRGRDGLLDAAVSDKLFLEMSTVRPETKKALARDVQARGAALVDCPVGGTIGPARDGKLLGFAGGEAGDVLRAKPVLDQLCRRVEHVGPVGAGASMKLAINLPLLVFWQALGEALVLCRSLRLDPQRVMDIFADTSGAPTFLKLRGSKIAAALEGEEPGPVTFDVNSIRKDLGTMIAEAKALGATLPVAERALECFDEAAREGLGGRDGVALPVRWAKRARNPATPDL
ncbi:MAG TPA: NAD(P)-dependent oxidoreductase [Burkholderiales bacterium]|nr:NAD(P)-dependent oxidoreductase [Burkholderiales bacterium]